MKNTMSTQRAHNIVKQLSSNLKKKNIKKNPLWENTVYPPEWVKLRLWRASVGKDVEPSELSYIPVGNVKWFNHFEKQFGCFL